MHKGAKEWIDLGDPILGWATQPNNSLWKKKTRMPTIWKIEEWEKTMKLAILKSLVVLLATTPGLCENLYEPQQERSFLGESSSSDGASSIPRVLLVQDFVPLNCNNGIENQTCLPWSTRFGNAAIQNNRVIVNCGECIDMDFANGPVLTLLGGLDIRGKLVFRDGYQLVVNTTLVVVQGVLILQSTKPIDGKPTIKFFMSGETDQYFEPIANNAMKCDATKLCLAGKKAIAVAGGRIEVNGLPDPKMPTWVKLFDVAADGNNNLNILIVDRAVKGLWAPGAEVLITSHTAQWDGHQIRKIQNISVHSNPNFVRIKLNATIVKPTTVQDSPLFAVEVALLSRNILFEGGPDSNPLHGGHFWILNTPFVEQHIAGLEVRNFGQQGSLGRYPIHFHFNRDVNGSFVSKNTVRNSYQRAIVVHGTNKLLVEGNVVFNTKGHAIILEDGIETDNIFYRNLGAATGVVDVLIPDNGFNGKETDDRPATYWITNPMNTYIENVAAGSQNSGFWFELKKRGLRASQFSFDPLVSPLGKFVDNVAHSSFDRGLRTYPKGFVPVKTANFVGLLSYKNAKGLFFHQSENLAIINSTFADNGISVDFDRADFVSVINTTFIGQSSPTYCNMQSYMAGIELDTFLRQIVNDGGQFRNITFAGFQSSTCNSQVAHVKLDNSTQFPNGQSTFEWLANFEQVNILDNSVIFDFCPAAAVNVNNVYLVDVDGSLDDKRNGNKNPGTMVSYSDTMMKFVDASKCTIKTSQCRAYCDACFRTVRLATDPEGTNSYLLQVCDSTGSRCIRIPGYLDLTSNLTKDAQNLRIYYAHLPNGSYTASFVNAKQGTQRVWPTFVNDTYEQILCSGSLGDGAIEVIAPAVNRSACRNLIRNGNAQNLNSWLYRRSGLTLLSGAGIDGSNALSDTEQTSASDAISQYLDTRCFDLMKGESYEVTAWVRLIDATNNSQDCQQDNLGCPEVRLFLTPNVTLPYVATPVPQFYQTGFHLLHGILTVDQQLADSKIVEFTIRRNRADFSMQVDNISAIRMPSLTPNDPLCSGELVWNSNFISGDAKFWSPSSAKLVIIKQIDGYHLSVSKGYAQTFLKAGCFQAGERYKLSIQYKVLLRGQLVACNSTVPGGLPFARLFPMIGGVLLNLQANIVQPLETGPDSGYCYLYGIFTASSNTGSANRLMLRFENLNYAYEYIIHHVSITYNPKNCGKNMLANGDMLMGVKSFWSPFGSGSVAWTSPGYDGSLDGAMLAYGRQSASHGPVFNADAFLDTRCLAPGSTLQIQAQMKLLDSATGQPTDCVVSDPSTSSRACPGLRFMITDASGIIVLDTQVRGYAMNVWNKNGWNQFSIQVPLPMNWDGTVSHLFLQIRNFPASMNLVLDKFVVRKVS